MPSVELSRWDWLLASVVIATLASMLHWSVRRQAELRDGFWQSLQHWIENPWFRHSVRLVYAVGLPAALLFWQHTLTGRGLGLKALPSSSAEDTLAILTKNTWENWIRDAGWATLIGFITAAALALGARSIRRGNGEAEIKGSDPLSALREAVYHQVHSAFYREPFVVAFGLIHGSWLGLAPILVEALIDPMFWETATSGNPAMTRRLLVRAGLFIAGTQVYVATQNLWMAIAVDALVGWIFVPTTSRTVPTMKIRRPASTTP